MILLDTQIILVYKPGKRLESGLRTRLPKRACLCLCDKSVDQVITQPAPTRSSLDVVLGAQNNVVLRVALTTFYGKLGCPGFLFYPCLFSEQGLQI